MWFLLWWVKESWWGLEDVCVAEAAREQRAFREVQRERSSRGTCTWPCNPEVQEAAMAICASFIDGLLGTLITENVPNSDGLLVSQTWRQIYTTKSDTFGEEFQIKGIWYYILKKNPWKWSRPITGAFSWDTSERSWQCWFSFHRWPHFLQGQQAVLPDGNWDPSLTWLEAIILKGRTLPDYCATLHTSELRARSQLHLFFFLNKVLIFICLYK